MQLREVRMKPKIDDHDIDFKTRTAAKLLKQGDKVKVTVMFRGREITHPQIGKNLLDRVLKSLDDIAILEKDADARRPPHDHHPRRPTRRRWPPPRSAAAAAAAATCRRTKRKNEAIAAAAAPVVGEDDDGANDDDDAEEPRKPSSLRPQETDSAEAEDP